MGFYEKMDDEGKIHDPYRIDFYKNISNRLKIGDGVEVWCISSEMEKRYGFIYVDYDNYHRGTRKRVCKDSYAWYKKAVSPMVKIWNKTKQGYFE